MIRNKIIVPTFLVLVFLTIFGSLLFKKSHLSKNMIKGTVTKVVDRPNQAEDGYYGFDVRDSSGIEYSIDATGYLNTPFSPDGASEACVYVPKVKAGDKVEFYLPISQYQPKTYDICYSKNLTDYYFKLD